MKRILRAYVFSAVVATTTAVGACFIWYVQEYDLAYKLDKKYLQRAQLHRTNAPWLGLWDGIYGLTGVVAASALLLERNEKS